MKSLRIALVGLLASVTLSAVAGEKGFLGLMLSVDGDGFFLNPTLKSVKIDQVVPNSPAAKAGIEPGDLVLEIEGKKIAGAKANDMKPHLEKEVGQTVRLAIQKSNGEVKQFTVVAAAQSD